MRYLDEKSGARMGALACWKPYGVLRWRVQTREASQLVLAGDRLVLAYDDGTLHAVRGLVSFDAATGRKLSGAALPGRPLAMAWYPDAKCLVLVLMPQHRLDTLKDAWMEVLGSSAAGEICWSWKADVTDLEPVCLDGRALVVASRTTGRELRARLDPATGRELWRRSWSVGEGTAARPIRWADPSSVVPVDVGGRMAHAGPRVLHFVDLATGGLALRLPVEELFPAAAYLHWVMEGDAGYLAASTLDGLIVSAVRVPGNVPRWSQTIREKLLSKYVAEDGAEIFVAGKTEFRPALFITFRIMPPQSGSPLFRQTIRTECIERYTPGMTSPPGAERSVPDRPEILKTVSDVNQCVRNPVLWNNSLVFIARNSSDGFAGVTTRTELRVCDRDGRLLAGIPRIGDRDATLWDDTVPLQPCRDRLYAVDGPALVALAWQH